MRLHVRTVAVAVTLEVALALAVLSGQAHGKAVDVIGLSGDDTRHGIVTHYGAWRSAHPAENGNHDLLQEWNSSLVEVSKYHVDTLVQTRFAHTTVEVEVRNKGLDGKRSITLPFAVPTDAMLTQFIVVADGKEFQARPVLREEINVDSTSSSATIAARDAESFDVTMDLVQNGIVKLRLEYEQLLTRHLGRYRNAQQIWPGTVVKDMRISVRIKEATDIDTDVKHFVTTELANGAVATVEAQQLRQITTVVTAMQKATTGGVREVTVTLQPTEEQQRFLATQLSKPADQGFGGQFNVEYEVERYPKNFPYIWRLNSASKSPTCNAYGVVSVPAAQQRADQIIADGNTIGKLLDGMEQSFKCAKGGPAGFEPVLFVLTDGLPSEPTDQVIQRAAQLNNKGDGVLASTVYTLAFGAGANLDFLKELAERNAGFALQLSDSTDASSQLRDFYGSIPSPVLMDVSIAFDKRQAMVTQKKFRAYFWGSELVVAGRLFANSDTLTGTVTALGVSGKVSYPYPIHIQATAQPEWQPEKLRGVANSERLWAFLSTSQQLDQALLDGEDSAAAKAATAMALEHSFVTTHTCLALDVVNPYSASTPAATNDPTVRSTTTAPRTPGSTATAAPGSTSTAAATTPSDGPVGPAPPPLPPRPDDNSRDIRDIRNDIAIGSIDVTTLSVNGPLLQFNLR